MLTIQYSYHISYDTASADGFSQELSIVPTKLCRYLQHNMIKSFEKTQEIVLFTINYIQTEKSTIYLYQDGLKYVATTTPPDLPFVVAVTGDVYDVILERLKRLAARQP